MEFDISVQEYLQRVHEKNFGRPEFLHHVMDESKKLNEEYQFFSHIDEWSELSFASPLSGLPVSVKDSLCVKDIQSSAGSRILAGYIPPMDATAVLRTKEAGGNIIGKTNQDEFGFGSFSVNSGFGIPKNPHDPRRTCGGSSGGAAGHVAAAKFPTVALAESTGGSISCPAAFCGVVGLTPTYGLVSRYGLIDYANSLDKIGCIGKRVFDVALLLSQIAGFDERDQTTVQKKKYDYTRHTRTTNLHKVKIAVPKEYTKGISKDVESVFWKAIARLEEAGTKYREVSLPTTKVSLSAYYIIAMAEASTNLAKYCGLRYGKHEEITGSADEYFSAVRTKHFSEEAKRRIILGTFARMAGYREQYYLQAMKIRTMVINDFKKVFKKFDAVAAPTMPVAAPKFKEILKMSPIQQYQMDVLTVAPNLAGIPHMSVPAGETKNLPVGLHLMTDHLQEGKLISIASAFEHVRERKK